MIKKYSLLALEKAINYALALDPATPEKMAALGSKVIQIIIDPLKVTFFIRFQPLKLELLDDYDKEADTVIRSNPIGLIRLSFLPASKVRSMFNDNIHLTGDLEVGALAKELFDNLDIDWEGHLAQFTGDVIAYQVGSLFKRGLKFQRQLTENVQYQITDYLHEELRLFPPREEIDDFFQEVDELRLDVERLEATIKLELHHDCNEIS